MFYHKLIGYKVFVLKNLEKICLFLEQEKKLYCDDCLSQLSGVKPRQTVNAICRENPEIFMTENTKKCFYCKKIKITRGLKIDEKDVSNLDDLKKAKFYLDRFINSQENSG